MAVQALKQILSIRRNIQKKQRDTILQKLFKVHASQAIMCKSKDSNFEIFGSA